MKKLLVLLVLPLIALAASFSMPALAHAQSFNGSKSTACDALGADPLCSTNPGQKGVEGIVRAALNILSVIVGAASVIMIIIGGLKYVVSGGDSNAVASAKNTLVYAIVGLVITLLAQSLVRFVFTKAATCTPNAAKNIKC